MIIHIVRNNESVNDIIENYHITMDELKNNNQHITNFRNLESGTKLKIPYLSGEVKQILETTEPFIDNYYPDALKPEEKKDDIANNVPRKSGIKYVNPSISPRNLYYPWFFRKRR